MTVYDLNPPVPTPAMAEEAAIWRRLGTVPKVRLADGTATRPAVVAARPGELPELAEVHIAPISEEGPSPVQPERDADRRGPPSGEVTGPAARAQHEGDRRRPPTAQDVDPTEALAREPLSVDLALAPGGLRLSVRYPSLARWLRDWDQLQFGAWGVDLPLNLHLAEGTAVELVLHPPGLEATHLLASVTSSGDRVRFEVEIPPDEYLRLAPS